MLGRGQKAIPLAHPWYDARTAGWKGMQIVMPVWSIGQRLIARYQTPLKEKPHAPVRRAGREEKSSGVALSQEAKSKSRPSTDLAGYGESNEHGTAQDGLLRMDERLSDIPCQLRLPFE